MPPGQTPGQDYQTYVSRVIADSSVDTGAKYAVGAEFDAIGIVEVETVRYYGLAADSYLIDVGCGSGRLAKPLSASHTGPYFGTDVVPDLIAYARSTVGRPDWRFEVIDGFTIPEADGVADMVCFFSVFTHLLHEQTYLYLEEASRVLKPGGKIVLSFLEFALEYHWGVFISSLGEMRAARPQPLQMFLDRSALTQFARHLGLTIDEFRDGTDRFIPLPQRVVFENGVVYEDFAEFGQSVCVLSKP